MLTVACIEVSDYLGRGAQYAETLRRMVARHLARPHVFVCLTDDPARHGNAVWAIRIDADLPGWWSKLRLFEPGRFVDRVVAFDLDTVIVGPLDELVEHKGTVHLTDWGWKENAYGNAVMVWDAGEHADIWPPPADVAQRWRGDNDYMFALGGWDPLPKGLSVSYRYESVKAPPAGACVVNFHGLPKPHQVAGGWVRDNWL